MRRGTEAGGVWWILRGRWCDVEMWRCGGICNGREVECSNLWRLVRQAVGPGYEALSTTYDEGVV